MFIVAALVNVTDIDPEKPGFAEYGSISTPEHEYITYTVDINMKFVVSLKFTTDITFFHAIKYALINFS